MEKFKFHNDAPMLNYYQKSLNSCCLRILLSSFASIEQTKSANDILLRIENYLKSEVGDRIVFANAILKNEKKIKANREFITA